MKNYVTKGVYKQRAAKWPRVVQKVRSKKMRLCNDSRGINAILRAGKSETGGYVTKVSIHIPLRVAEAMSQGIGENEAERTIAADALNAPSAVVVLGALLPTFVKSLLALPAKTIKELGQSLLRNHPKTTTKKNTVEAIVQNMKDHVNLIPIWGSPIDVKTANKWAANGVFGDRVGEVVKIHHWDSSDSDDRWNEAARFVKSSKTLDALYESLDSPLKVVRTTRSAIERRSNAAGAFDTSTVQNKSVNHGTGQQMRHEYRLRCIYHLCSTASGVQSFVRGVGMGASVEMNPPVERGSEDFNRASRDVVHPPKTLIDDDGFPVVHDTQEAKKACKCPTCGGAVVWDWRLAGSGRSNSQPVGGWGSVVKLPSIKMIRKTKDAGYQVVEKGIESNRLVNCEMNDGSPRISTTFNRMLGYPAYGRFGQGVNQREGYEADPEAYTIDKKGRRKGIPKTVHLPASIQRRVIPIQTPAGVCYMLGWVAVHDIEGLARGIDSTGLDSVALVMNTIRHHLDAGNEKAQAGSNLLDAIRNLTDY